MNIDIEIEGLAISSDLKTRFLQKFLQNLSQLDNDTIDSSICNSLATTVYKKPTDMLNSTYKKVKKTDEPGKCYICYEQVKDNEYKRELKCKHTFHKKCIDRLLNKYHHTKCPLCRKNVFSITHQHI